VVNGAYYGLFANIEHPTRGFLFLPTDLDRSISLSLFGADDNFFRPETLQPTAQLVLADPAWNARYCSSARSGARSLCARSHTWKATS
jgi:hypothetical protein